eukprot:7745492-Alexandrium_andersonii.AAC.1
MGATLLAEGAASRRPELPSRRALAHSATPGGRRPRGGLGSASMAGGRPPSEGHLGHRQATCATTPPELLRLGRP